MSSINPKYRNLYVGTDFSQDQFTKAMEDVYNYVTPYNLPDNITGITTFNHIRKLRRKLVGADDLFDSVHGGGYRIKVLHN